MKTNQALAMAWVLSLGACYSSSPRLGGDAGGGDARDAAGTDAIDARADAPADAAPDATDARPEGAPFDGLTFVVRNDVPRPGTDYYFAVWGYWYGPDPAGSVEYPYELAGFSGGSWASRDIYHQWCTLDCSEAPDPPPQWWCCIDCAPPPWSQTVRMLARGESFSTFWDGTLYDLSNASCECGCSVTSRASPGLYRVRICGSTRFVCLTDAPCEPDAEGFIQNAVPAEALACVEREFEIPATSGDFLLSFDRS